MAMLRLYWTEWAIVYRIAWFRGRPAMNMGVHIKLAYKRATIQQSNYKEKAIYIYTTQHSQPYTMRVLSTVKMPECSALVTLGRHIRLTAVVNPTQNFVKDDLRREHYIGVALLTLHVPVTLTLLMLVRH